MDTDNSVRHVNRRVVQDFSRTQIILQPHGFLHGQSATGKLECVLDERTQDLVAKLIKTGFPAFALHFTKVRYPRLDVQL